MWSITGPGKKYETQLWFVERQDGREKWFEAIYLLHFCVHLLYVFNVHSRHVNDNVKGDIIERLDGIKEAHIV